MSFTAKSVVFDCADSYEAVNYIGIRSVDFYLASVLVARVSGDMTCYATTSESGTAPEDAFITALSKTGSYVDKCWLSNAPAPTNQRLIMVNDSPIEFDEIVINNFHNSGSSTDSGAQNVKITISTDAITDTTYNAAVSNSTVIYNSTFDQHIASDVQDDQILTLITPETVDSEPFEATVSLSASPVIALSAGTLSLTTSMSASVFAGIQISALPLEITGSLSGNPVAVVSSESISATGEISATIFGGSIVIADPLSASGLLSANPVAGVSSEPLSITGTLSATIYAIGSVTSEIFQLTGTLSAGEPVTFTKTFADIYYFFTLTGDADGEDDVEIPISSFQCRQRSGDPTFLSVIIPDSGTWASYITARPNGSMKIDMAYKYEGTIIQRETIIEVDLTEVRYDEGAINQTITLNGYKTETFSAKGITLENSIYRNEIDGKIRHRLAEPNIYLRPGDTATVGTDTFVVDSLTFYVSVESKTMELAEA